MSYVSEPPPARKVRHLHYVQGMTYREIASMYGISLPLAYALGHQDEAVSEISHATDPVPFSDSDITSLLTTPR